MRHVINCLPDGTIACVYADGLVGLFDEARECYVWRASHVEPAEGGGWSADMSPIAGPVLGPFHLRSEALTAELEWIEREVLQCQ